MELHESVAHTKREMIIKEDEGFRLRMVKHAVLSPVGLFSINLINETLKEDGTVLDASTYNFFMTKAELNALAYAINL